MKNMRRQVPSLLKDGHKQYSGVQGVVLKNIEACKQLSKVTRTSLGPNGSSALSLSVIFSIFYLSCPESYFIFSICASHVSLVFMFGLVSVVLNRSEQDGDQPLGEAVCHQRRRHHSARDGHYAPGRQDAGLGCPAAGA
jgi:hypothetical protein